MCYTLYMEGVTMIIENSAEQRMPVAVAAKRAAKSILDGVRARAEAQGMTFEQACAQIRAQLDERIEQRKKFQLY